MKLLTSILLTSLFFFSGPVLAQFTIDAELRPRFEYRHGYKTLFPDNVDPASFVSQRTRLKVGYKMEKLKFYLSVQDVRVWGDVVQLNTSDKNGLSVHQAWGEVLFDPRFTLKLGRQEIVYDDHRIFGNVGWAQQARSHDVALIKYHKNALKINVGVAYNQDTESLTGNILTVNTYKSFQYVWLHNDWQEFSASLLVLNNGLQFIDSEDEDVVETRYSQTVGSHLVYKKKKLSFFGNVYYQFGKDRADNDLSAYLLGIEGRYKLSQKLSIGSGGELQSGNDNGMPSNGKNKAFTPLYGTNHKFNGLIDYFYVGNHIDNVGLLDLFAKVNLTINSKHNVNLAAHNFSASAAIDGTNNKQLGTEIDITYNYSYSKDVNFKAGYSHIFPSEGLEIVKNNFDENTNNWGWVMVTISPTLFQSESTKTQL